MCNVYWESIQAYSKPGRIKHIHLAGSINRVSDIEQPKICNLKNLQLGQLLHTYLNKMDLFKDKFKNYITLDINFVVIYVCKILRLFEDCY